MLIMKRIKLGNSNYYFECTCEYKKIDGYNRNDSILLGVESRTSSPVIIERDEEFVSSVIGVYPCGEGCGYAGGITTASIDGIKVFESIIKKYRI